MCSSLAEHIIVKTRAAYFSCCMRNMQHDELHISHGCSLPCSKHLNTYHYDDYDDEDDNDNDEAPSKGMLRKKSCFYVKGQVGLTAIR